MQAVAEKLVADRFASQWTADTGKRLAALVQVAKGYPAAKRALEDASCVPADIDCIILATLSPDIHFPGTAVFLQSKLGIDGEKEFSTYEYLGNIGTVSLPLTAALAEERGFLLPGDKVGFLGIGSGLNCLMLGVEW